MKKQVTLSKEFFKGVWDNNPVLKQLLGLCPTLAVTVSAINGLAMGLAATFVLVMASLLISSIRKIIPAQVRIASFIVIIATFVTIVDLVMKAKFPDLSKALGPFIPLIVVNCVILGRQEAFASKNNPGRAFLDALGMGTGFTIALLVLGGIREIIGSRTFFGIQIMPDQFEPWLIMILPAGAFLTLGLILGAVNVYIDRKKRLEHESIIAHYKRVGREELIEELEVK
ncbi:MAG: electron transport complex subunit E [Ignavibacterium sp.]|nr:electron transport complex subunit E [Ignavibacterium sp.]MCX7610454.1 electron transport complex subunit E [Ignavibacterium sp.]MDW8376317.1 electron transport complex subunit E [Ignavibacteriales bacterium]